LTNFNSSTRTLTGGTYIVGGTLQFANANIVTLGTGTSLTMSGATAQIEDQTAAADGLTNFATNNGTLNIASGTKFEVNLANSLTNFNSSTHTLTGGTYINSGVLQFANANIVTLGSATSLTMSGTSAKIEDQTGVADGATFRRPGSRKLSALCFLIENSHGSRVGGFRFFM
jgi:autotransporter-associated beta strand protein